MIPTRTRLLTSLLNGLAVAFPVHAITNPHCGPCTTPTQIEEPVDPEPDPVVLSLWSAGSGVAQKFGIGDPGETASTSNFDNGNTHRNVLAHHESGRVFIPSFDSIYIYTAGAAGDPIGAPVEIVYEQDPAASNSKALAAIDQEENVYAIVGGSHDTVMLIFDDNSTQLINVAGNPSTVLSIGGGKFFIIADDGPAYVYGPSNAYAAPLVTAAEEFGIVLGTAADVAGNRVFISNHLDDTIKIVNTLTGAVTSLAVGDRAGYRLLYNPTLDRLVMDNMDDVADQGSIFIIDPDVGVVGEVDFSANFAGATFNNGSLRDMAMIDDKVVVLATWTDGEPSTWAGAVMIDITLEEIIDEYGFVPANNPLSVTANDREGVFYIGDSAANEIAYLLADGPYYDYNTIDGWVEVDNRWIAWV